MFTPFGEDGRIDRAALAQEACFLKQCGVSGVVVGGSMGEGAGLSEQELAEAVRVVIAAVDGAIPVLAGIIADSSAEAVGLAKAVCEAGAAGLQVPPPHFRHTGQTSILADYYRAITDGSGLALIIYNVMPTAQAAVEALQELVAKNSAIVGVKQSGRNMHTLAVLLATMRGKIKLFSAIDDMIYPSFMLGVDGTISGTSAIFPREVVEMFHAVRAGEYDRALKLHERLTPVWRAVDNPQFPANGKYAVTLSGRFIGKPRRPLQWPSGEAARHIEQALAAGGLLHMDRSQWPEALQARVP